MAEARHFLNKQTARAMILALSGRYGHGKIESLGTLAVAAALVGTGVAMGVHSGLELWSLVTAAAAADAGPAASSAAALSVAAPPAGNATMAAAVGVAAGSVGAKEALYRYTLRVGEAAQNNMLAL